MSAPPVIAARDLIVRFPVKRNWRGQPQAWAHALNGVSFEVQRGQTLGIVGESGCGKSTLAQVLIGLLRPTEGRVEMAASAATPPRRHARDAYSRVGIVFQDPNNSLNPRMKVWQIITEPLRVNQEAPRARHRAIAVDLLTKVGLSEEHADRYPHEFSGGQRQRIAIARTLAGKPEIVILDEPTSALDISVQAQILNLLLTLQREEHLTYLFISHNMSVIRHFCDQVAVMYLGQFVEHGPTARVLGQPAHPYTQLLIQSVPRIGQAAGEMALDESELPSNRKLPQGCFFRGRCPHGAAAGCEQPQILSKSGDASDTLVRCHLAVDREH